MDLIKRSVLDVIPDAKIYVVGGAAEDRLTALSDIDVFVVSEKIPGTVRERARLVASIMERAESMGLPWDYPLEIHLLKPCEAVYVLRKCRKVISLNP